MKCLLTQDRTIFLMMKTAQSLKSYLNKTIPYIHINSFFYVFLTTNRTYICFPGMNNMNIENAKTENWSEVILPKRNWLSINLKELWQYKDLILLFVRRDFVALYKQTILGPFWYILQPLMQTFIYTVMFGNIFSIQDETGVPSVLFYLSGTISWLYFSQCVTKTSFTFSSNAGIFGKVYFPRLTVPLSILISNLIGFGVQFGLFLLFYLYYCFFQDMTNNIGIDILILIPLLLLNMAFLGMGIGLIVSSLTTKYKDFTQLISFGVQLLMFASPVIIPISIVTKKFPEWTHPILEYNPMTPIIEGFRTIFFQNYAYDKSNLLYSFSVALILLIVGLILFKKTEQNFMDTI